jgi:hypothetical protein
MATASFSELHLSTSSTYHNPEKHQQVPHLYKITGKNEGMLYCVILQILIDVSQELTACIIRVMTDG